MKKTMKKMLVSGASAAVFALACLPGVTYAAAATGAKIPVVQTDAPNTTRTTYEAPGVQAAPGPYFTVLGGLAFPGNIKLDSWRTSGGNTLSSDDVTIKSSDLGVTGVLGAGIAIPVRGPNWTLGAFRLGGELGFSTFALQDVDRMPGNPSKQVYYGNLMATAAFELNTNTPLVPYVGVGIGPALVTQYQVKVKSSVSDPYETSKKGALVLGWEWNAGAKFQLSKALALNAQYRMDIARTPLMKIEADNGDSLSGRGTMMVNSLLVGVDGQF